MNIMYILQYWPMYGGGETVTVTLSNELVKRGHNVFVVYDKYKYVTPEPYTINVKIKALKIKSHIYNKDNIKTLNNYIASNKIDIIINQWGNTKLCNEARKGTTAKLITCWHQEILPKFDDKSSKLKNFLNENIHWLYEWNEKRWKMKIHMVNYTLSDKYVFLSDSFLKNYISLSRNKSIYKKLTFIPNPLTYKYFYDINDYYIKKKELLFVGRMLEVHKRMSYILKIWSKLCRDTQLLDWKLIMVGDGPDINKTKQLAQKLKLNNIFFEGFKDPRKYYESASLFVMTSASEGLGMTLLEAQQYAVVPFVMDTYSSLHDIIKDDENGVIIKENDFDEYQNRLKELMINENKRKTMAINGIKSCQKFSVERVVDKWEELFNNIE